MSLLHKVSPTLTPLLLLGILANSAQGQSVPVVSDNAGTVVSQNGSTVNITGTNLSKDGANLFHSFQQFSLSQGQTANFLTNPSVRNILGRVTGGNASVINGLIKITSTDPNQASTANLYLMNPAGILFGSNASLNVPGSFMATTANGIGFNGTWFNAIGPNHYAELVGNPDTLAFTMNQPGAIVNASNLAVQTGKTLALLGGTVVSTAPIGTSTLYPGILIAAVPGSSLVRISQPGSLLSIEIQPASVASSLPTDLPATQLPVSLPQLITGGGGGGNYGLTVGSDGRVTITGSGVQVKHGDVVLSDVSGGSLDVASTGDLITKAIVTSLNPLNKASADVTLVSNGKVIVDTIRVKQEGFIYDGQAGMTVTIRAFDVFQAQGTLSIGSSFSGVSSIPTSIITQGKTDIEYGGQALTVGLGVERDAVGNIVYRAPSKQVPGTIEPVSIDPQSSLLKFVYANGSPASDVTVRLVPFNPNGVASNTSYTAGAILNGAGSNATLYSTFQNFPLTSGVNPYIQVSKIDRPPLPIIQSTSNQSTDSGNPTTSGTSNNSSTTSNSDATSSQAGSIRNADAASSKLRLGQEQQVIQQSSNSQAVACDAAIAGVARGLVMPNSGVHGSTVAGESSHCTTAASSPPSSAKDGPILKVTNR